MTTILASAIILLCVGIYWKRLHQKYVRQKFKYALFTLRDELRSLAIEGKVDKNSMIFSYYDGSLSKTINRSYYLTFPWLFLLYLVHGQSKELDKLHHEIEEETNKNPYLVKINKQFIHETHHYLIGQHYVTFKIITPLVYALIGAKIAKSRFKRVVTSTLYNPETSLSEKYTMEPIVC